MAKMDIEKETAREKRKPVTLFDAVSGRVGYEGFLTEQQPSRYRDTASTSLAPVPPDEVLFRRKGAPLRFEEDDIYSADRHLQSHQRLPESDLLKTIHAYVAGLYSSAIIEEGQQSFRSMDETALLAMGVLLEEAAIESLGSTGDLAFAEQSDDLDDQLENSINNNMYWHDGQWRRNVVNQPQNGRGLKQGRSRSRAARNRVPIRSRSGRF